MSVARTMILITAILEGVLGIPFLGGLMIMAMAYVPLFIMLVLHIVTLVLVNQERRSKAGSVLGIITSCIAWVPFLGMCLHIATAVTLFITYAKGESNRNQTTSF